MTTKPLLIPNLTPLRGLAAVIVMLYHYAKAVSVIDIRGSAGLVGHGYLMVDFFFILSGFVIANVYHAAFSDRPRAHTIAAFMAARISRPAYGPKYGKALKNIGYNYP